MHLEGPWLSTTGKKKGKQKFRNSAQAQKARELEESWNGLLEKYKPAKKQPAKMKNLSSVYKLSVPPGRETRHIPSLNNGVDSGSACLAPTKVYTGTKMKGIGTMHKSNSVPVFSNEEAQDIARMRR